MVCVLLNSATGDAALFVRRDWTSYVLDKHREYIEATLSEWSESLKKNPAEILQVIAELSVGPIRMVKDGECDERNLLGHVEAFLQGPYRSLA